MSKGGVIGNLFNGPKTPDAPDYVGAANATAKGNLEAAQAAAAANRVNQNTPYGSLRYTESGKDSYGNPTWTADTTLNALGQKTFDQQQQLSDQYAGLAGKGFNALSGLLANPNIDQSKLAAQTVNAGQTGQDAIMSRLAPQYAREGEQLRTQLANQGIAPGSEAYNNAFTQQNQKENDAYQMAALNGINVGNQARQQGIQEQQTFMQQPLNIVNALRTGAQTQLPTFQNVPQQATTGGADILGATGALGNFNTNMYSNKVAQNNAMLNGLFSLGGAAIMA